MCDHSHSVSGTNPSVHQTLDELEFERSLGCAALNGEVDRVQDHLRKGINVNSLDAAGYAPLHYAARKGNVDVAQILISHGADINIRTRAGKTTPLLRAAYSGKEDMCKLLIGRGADVIAVDDDGLNVLHRALSSGNLSLARYLLGIAPELKTMTDNKGIAPKIKDL